MTKYCTMIFETACGTRKMERWPMEHFKPRIYLPVAFSANPLGVDFPDRVPASYREFEFVGEKDSEIGPKFLFREVRNN